MVMDISGIYDSIYVIILVRRADTLTTICEPIVYIGTLISHNPYRPPRPVRGIALLYFTYLYVIINN
jgi:hypothetical protein